MPETRLLIIGIVVGVLVLLIAVGSAVLALGDSFRDLHDAKRRREEQEEAPPPPPPPARRRPERYTPERTRLRWHSPEILAVLLLTLAAGLWLARIVG